MDKEIEKEVLLDKIIFNGKKYYDYIFFIAVYLNDKLYDKYKVVEPKIYIIGMENIYNEHRYDLILDDDMSKEMKTYFYEQLSDITKQFDISYKKDTTKMEKSKVRQYFKSNIEKDNVFKKVFGESSFHSIYESIKCIEKVKEEIEKVSSKMILHKLHHNIQKLLDEFEYIIYCAYHYPTLKNNISFKDYDKILDDISQILYSIYIANTNIVSNESILLGYRNKLDKIRPSLNVKLDQYDPNIETNIENKRTKIIIFEYYLIARLNKDYFLSKEYIDTIHIFITLNLYRTISSILFSEVNVQ